MLLFLVPLNLPGVSQHALEVPPLSRSPGPGSRLLRHRAISASQLSQRRLPRPSSCSARGCLQGCLCPPSSAQRPFPRPHAHSSGSGGASAAMPPKQRSKAAWDPPRLAGQPSAGAGSPAPQAGGGWGHTEACLPRMPKRPLPAGGRPGDGLFPVGSSRFSLSSGVSRSWGIREPKGRAGPRPACVLPSPGPQAQAWERVLTAGSSGSAWVLLRELPGRPTQTLGPTAPVSQGPGAVGGSPVQDVVQAGSWAEAEASAPSVLPA